MFQGYFQTTISFLNGLKENNTKAWFEAHKPDYQKFVLEPSQELVTELAPLMLSIDPKLEVSPKKSISRIYRDVRFSKDKSPYRCNVWLAFKRVYPDWKCEPAYFFEISPDSYRYGLGFYNISKENMDQLRRQIDEKDREFAKILALYQNQRIFTVAGEKYKRILNDQLPEDLQEWYQRKDLYLVHNQPLDDRLFSRELLDDLIEGFKLVAPVYEFFLS